MARGTRAALPTPGTPRRTDARREGTRPRRRAVRWAAETRETAGGAVEEGRWVDDFSQLQDRRADEPLPLPVVPKKCRVVLVRHGQSTWNAEGRMQGCSDFSVLTGKGQGQARKTHVMLQAFEYDALHHSPLKRAAETAEIVWGADRDAPVHVHASLREIDLYTMQGLLKKEGAAKFPDEYAKWKDAPAEFELPVGDGVQQPVVELWHRGSLAWHDVLVGADAGAAESRLVVAHNAINQAMIGTALGLPPRFFRRVLQNNAAVSTFVFNPDGDGGMQVRVGAVNATPGVRSLRPRHGAPAQVVLVRHVEVTDEGAPTDVGWTEASRVAGLLRRCNVSAIAASPERSALATAGALVEELRAKPPHPEALAEAAAIRAADAEDAEGGESTVQPRGVRLLAMESLEAPQEGAWNAAGDAWEALCEEADRAQDGTTVVAFARAEMVAALVARALGADNAAFVHAFESDMPFGALTCILRPKGGSKDAVLRSFNTGAVDGVA